MSLWTAGFWKATAERVISTGAQAAILAIGADQFSALAIRWQDVLGFALGGAALSLLKALAANAITKDGPGFTNAEVVPDQYDRDPE